ncbi:lipid-A-disaccharide synthase-related protein [uncultured Deinococcus sp.]|uniref:lipid-A-disaccharide synthase-related protein n=1 Tax=uncultured Deinococcus sp. TaxID=158789 RepID=UPI00258FED91|nr:lipid-A-disaccharide synthase-related protein [uncultured Deinococcus sp.]
MSAPALLLISNGHAEDLIGAALGRELRRLSPELSLLALPLVGEGRAYAGVAEVAGPVLNLPSGGFPFGSLENLRADLGAGLVGTSVGQAVAARLRGTQVGRVVVVGDTYALALGALAAGAVPGGRAGRRLPLVHLQPLVSVLYAQDLGVRGHLRELNALGANAFMPWETALGRRAERVYTRDAASARHLARRGVNAAYRGGFAPDILPPPERGLEGVRDGRPVLALLPGQRGDARTSLPVMLDAAARLPEFQALVAWPRDWAGLPPLPGWAVRPESDSLAWAMREDVRVGLLRGAFSAVLHAAADTGGLALGTAGTASEQAAALGVPVVGFPTAGPQYVPGFAARQARLLGAALTLTAPEGEAVASAVQALAQDGRRLAFARAQGRERMGTPGALAQIAREILGVEGGSAAPPPPSRDPLP